MFMKWSDIPDRGRHGSGTNDIVGGPKSWGTSQKVEGVEVSDFCGLGTKTDFEDQV